jgi:hypothetical protein
MRPGLPAVSAIRMYNSKGQIIWQGTDARAAYAFARRPGLSQGMYVMQHIGADGTLLTMRKLYLPARSIGSINDY